MPTIRTRTRTTLTAAAIAGALLGVPAAASADSIVYIEGGNVVTSRPDGSGKVQLTDGGNWHSPTQADDGTIAAVQGTGPIQVLAPDGRPLRSITTPGAPSADGGRFAGAPVALSFSPDGSKIAYSYTAYSCPVASSCGTIQRSTFYTRAGVTEATPHAEWGNQFGVGDPEWVTNDRALVFGGSGSQVNLDDLGGGDYSFVNWIKPQADQGDGELSRDGRRLATTFFYGPEKTIALFAVKGDPRTETPPAKPDVACSLEPADEKFSDPSWSPDGSSLAYGTAKGVEILTFTEFGPGACSTTGESRVLSAGGTSPDWGPADPPARRWQATPPPGGGGTDPNKPADGSKPPAERPETETETETEPSARVRLTATSLARVLRRGLKVSATGLPDGRHRVVVRHGRKTVGARKVVVRGGRLATTVRFTKAARRALARKRRATLKVSVAGTTGRVTLRR